jgi:WD40 repeat protein
LAAGGEDGKLILWDATDGWPTTTLPAPHAPPRPPGTFGKLAAGVLSIEFFADGRFASCGRDRKVCVWDPSGKRLQAFDCASLPTKVAVAHDGAAALCGEASGELRFLSLGANQAN